MRPRIFALLAVSAVALVGCSASEAAPEPNAPAVGSTTPAPSPAEVSKKQSNEADAAKEKVQDDFLLFAEMRSAPHGVETPSDKKLIKALHDYCEGGKPVEVSTESAYNQNLQTRLTDEVCEPIK